MKNTVSDDSLSFIEMPWSSENKSSKNINDFSETLLRNFIVPSNPAFINNKVLLPEIFKNYFKDFHLLDIKFNFCKQSSVLILDHDVLLYEIPIVLYENLNEDNLTCDLTFIINRKAFIRQCNTRTQKEYKKAVLDNISFEDDDTLKVKEVIILEAQLKHKNNVLFLDSIEDLRREITVLIKYTQSKAILAPKTKKFDIDKKKEHLYNLLLRIPGLGKNCCYSLSEHFLTLKSFMNFFDVFEKKRFEKIQNS